MSATGGGTGAEGPQTLAQLQRQFGIEGHAWFSEQGPGMIRLHLAARDSQATLQLYGAHVTHWAPRGMTPVLYLSPKAVFEPGKAIRGGVPVLFPWFGPRWNGAAFDAAHGTKSPAHGFARTRVWTLDSLQLTAEQELVTRLSLAPDAASRTLGFDDFRLVLECSVGRELHIALHVTNLGREPLEYEEGLHTYLAVADVHAARLTGLRGSLYLDKRDSSQRKHQQDEAFAFTRDVDQTYLHTAETVSLHDPAGHRVVRTGKIGSQTTVIWNPWTLLTPGFPDLPEDGWRDFVCVESVNAEENRVRLAPGARHVMGMTLSVDPI